MNEQKKKTLAFALSVYLATLTGNARADSDDTAAPFFRAGVAAYERGDSRAAALAFDEAYRRAPRPATAYNAGLAWEDGGEKARAADAYARATRDGSLDAPSLQDARERLASLEKALGVLRVEEPRGGTLYVAHVEGAPIPIETHVAPGTYTVRVRDASRVEVSRQVTVAAGGVARLALEVPTAPANVSAVPRIAGWASLGGAAVFSGAAVYLGISTLNAQTEYDRSGHTDAGVLERGTRLRTWTNVAWASAAVAAAAGVVLLVVSQKPPPSTARNATPLGVIPF